MGSLLQTSHWQYGHLAKEDVHASNRAPQELSAHTILDIVSDVTIVRLAFVASGFLGSRTITFLDSYKLLGSRTVDVTITITLTNAFDSTGVENVGIIIIKLPFEP